MTQSQTQTPEKQNTFAALDKKVADGMAADKAATQQPAVQPQPATEPQKPQDAVAPAAKS